MAKQGLTDRALQAYENHVRQEQEAEKKRQEDARLLKVKKLQEFLESVGENVSIDEPLQELQSTREGLTFSINAGSYSDEICVRFQCKKCRNEHISPAIHNLIDLGKFLSAECPPARSR